ncbi:hypothetical protein N7493_010272 [Penicillium malachiteum]|uniref:Uncharacterized protein n=1 Tax=Penicillium malachiteum TaxID=1324776 RepID=A0AAD6MRI5_9EURO|nr:hypothetical protein N7493_010272 [Penicillium malachiteum]KAJ5723636.1 hypothetical protein N7488_001671 [Penicillium malachiteum]
MNTIRSTWVGWGTLCVAGGGAYYFAKQSINADRQSRFEAEMKRKAQMKAIEDDHRRRQTTPNSAVTSSDDTNLAPSVEASSDPAATRHEPLTENDRVLEKSKYEAAAPFRPPSGNRFS